MRLDSTYRLQFRNGMTFDRAAAIVPYLRRLGVSHLYASPIFAATGGSTHGYDVVDHNSFDPALGGKEGFDRLSDALRANGLGLLLDIVPNHMGASSENPWWTDVLEWGRASAYASYFDIDWREGGVTLPFLGNSFEECLAKDELALAVRADGRLVLAYYDNWWPLTPPSWPLALSRLEYDGAGELAAMADKATPASAETLHAAMREASAGGAFERQFKALSGDKALIRDLHDRQPWRLFEWREGRRHLTYRRFFEITGLVGVRVEDEQVFDDVHRTILDLVAQGRVHGLRIDHVDGLSDPTAYLKRLRQRVGPAVPILVEKILEGRETLLPEWPIEGTTGYEFIASLATVFTDGAKANALTRAYEGARGMPLDYAAEMRAAKEEIATWNLEGELSLLSGRALDLAASLAPDCADEADLRGAIVAVVEAFPIYRTYVNNAGPGPVDLEWLAEIEEKIAATSSEGTSAHARFVMRLLRLEVPDELREEALAFVVRFQQTTGPVMAKAVEDTLFFRVNRLMALNEVGGDPEAAEVGIDAFHMAMADRNKTEPQALSATATHDTKRGEDARARLYTISEAPERWGEAVNRWRAMHRGFVTALNNMPVPDGEMEWMLYQALLGAWPMKPEGGDWLASLGERFLVFVEKAMREDKRHTSWTEVDEPYEAAVRAYAGRLVDPQNSAFIEDFAETARVFVASGVINSLSQTLIKLTAPGIPDIYNGTEKWDLSFVDPDNRRPVDFEDLASSLDRAAASPSPPQDMLDGSYKQHLVAAGLRARAREAELFARGSYEPIAVVGGRAAHLVAFARRHRNRHALVLAPCRVIDLIDDDTGIPPEAWQDTTLELSEAMRALPFTNMLTGETLRGSDIARVATALGTAPVGFFLSQ